MQMRGMDMGNYSESKGGNLSSVEKEVFDHINRLIGDEQFQLKIAGPQFRAAIEGQAACDIDPEGTGPFGLVETNPIPVNGGVGELAYLSRIMTVRSEPIFFHRLGSIDRTDIFEAVTVTGSEWFILFVDMYYPRQSRLTPAGFCFKNEPSRFLGFHDHCSNFPYGFVEKQHKMIEKEAYLYVGYESENTISKVLKGRKYERPPAHNAKLEGLKFSSKLLDNCTIFL
jgi:hypothetical protein